MNLILFGIEMEVGDIIDSIMAIFTFFSLILVWRTNVEMGRERDATYKPSLLMNPLQYTVSWNDEGEESWLSLSKNHEKVKKYVDEDKNVHISLGIPIKFFLKDGLEEMSLLNVGVGTAKNIVLKWDDNIKLLMDQLIAINPLKKDFCHIDQNITFLISDGIIVTDIPRAYQFMYMLPNAQQKQNFPIPMAYTILIHEILKEKKGRVKDELIYFILEMEYIDIQGKKFVDRCLIYVKTVFSKSDLDNENSVTYQLVPKLLE